MYIGWKMLGNYNFILNILKFIQNHKLWFFNLLRIIFYLVLNAFYSTKVLKGIFKNISKDFHSEKYLLGSNTELLTSSVSFQRESSSTNSCLAITFSRSFLSTSTSSYLSWSWVSTCRTLHEEETQGSQRHRQICVAHSDYHRIPHQNHTPAS